MPRHYLEKALEEAIQEKDIGDCETLINKIKEKPGASLWSKNEGGKSFLFLSLEFGTEAIAKLLIEEQAHNDDILFGKDKNNVTLLHLVASKGYVEFVAKLIAEAEKKQKIEEFLSGDKEGNTVFHYAALCPNEAVAALILEKTKDKGSEFINQANQAGDTALHKAIEFAPNQSIAAFVNHGASLTVENNKRITPFKAFCLLSLDKQCSVFSLLNKSKQNNLLNLYQELVIKHSDSEEIRKIYFKLASLCSLKSLLIAHHEFNQAMPVRNSYAAILRTTAKTDDKKNYQVQKEEKFIPDDILEQMPFYQEKVLEAENDITVARQSAEGWKKIHNSRVGRNSLFNYERLNNDRVTISSLIDDIDHYLAVLQAKPVYSRKTRKLTVSLSILYGMIYAGLESWLIYKANTIDFHSDHEQYWKYNGGGIFFGALGGMAELVLMMGALLTWNNETAVSHHEWKEMVESLRKDILEKLQCLEKKEQEEHQSYLSTHAQNVRDLENCLAELSPAKLSLIDRVLPLYKSRNQVIFLFTKLKQIVETIRDDINLSKKPLSVEAAEVVIDMPLDLESQSETTPLLAAGRSIRRYS